MLNLFGGDSGNGCDGLEAVGDILFELHECVLSVLAQVGVEEAAGAVLLADGTEFLEAAAVDDFAELLAVVSVDVVAVVLDAGARGIVHHAAAACCAGEHGHEEARDGGEGAEGEDGHLQRVAHGAFQTEYQQCDAAEHHDDAAERTLAAGGDVVVVTVFHIFFNFDIFFHNDFFFCGAGLLDTSPRLIKCFFFVSPVKCFFYQECRERRNLSRDSPNLTRGLENKFSGAPFKTFFPFLGIQKTFQDTFYS